MRSPFPTHHHSKDVLGYKKTTHKEWITLETLNKIMVRKQKNAKLNSNRTKAEKAHKAYPNANKVAKKSTWTDKRNVIDKLTSKAEEAAMHGNTKVLYNITKKLTVRFTQLLNRPVPMDPPDIQPARHLDLTAYQQRL